MLERLLKDLKEERIKIALQAMEAPAQDLFSHGLTVGSYQGMKKAEEILERILNEADEKERDSEQRFR